MVKVNVVVYGDVPKGFIDFVVRTLNNFYEDLQPDLPIVDLYIYSTVKERRQVIMEEAIRRGVSVVGDFVTSHDAWSGVPRIHICYELLKNLSIDLVEALIIHEGAHSILHGTVISYIISPSSEVINELGLEKVLTATYIISTAIKDYEVVRFLLKKSYKKYVIKYIDYVINEFQDARINSYNKLQIIKALASVTALFHEFKDVGEKYINFFKKFIPDNEINTFIEIFSNVVKDKQEFGINDKTNALLTRLIKENII